MSQYLPENLFKKYCVVGNCTKTLPAPPPLPFLLPLPAFLLLPFDLIENICSYHIGIERKK